jgi:endonuclease IV
MTKLGIHVSKVRKFLPGGFYENTSNVFSKKKQKQKLRKTILESIKIDTNDLNIDCVQIFVSGPRNTIMNKIDYTAVNKYCSDEKINLYVHSNYMSIAVFNLTQENKNTPKMKNAIQNIQNQMNACDKLNANGFVIHLSKKTPDMVVETLKILYPLIKKYKTPFLLEQPARKTSENPLEKTQTYETPEKINNLTKLIIKTIPKLNWGWCIDTVHIWSSGIKLNDCPATKKWFKNLKYKNYIKLFHLNGGNIDIFNTGSDNHKIPFGPDDDIFKGFNIKTPKKFSINIITNFAKKNNIDLIMEINRGALSDVNYAINTINKLKN